MVAALHRAEKEFITLATCVGSEVKAAKTLPTSIKNGAPGGCPTSSLSAEAMNSPQSQKGTLGSTVNR